MLQEFMALSPSERCRILQGLVKEFGRRASEVKAPFSILVYGSTSYGFNSRHYGHIDDIDMFLVVPRMLDARKFLEIAGEVFQSDFDVSHGHLQKLLDGSWEICRMYGHADGIRLGFRLICSDIFAALSTPKGMVSRVRNVAQIGASRIIVDKQWSIEKWQYVPMRLRSELFEEENPRLLSVDHRVFSRSGKHLGALGRKLLTCTVVYDHAGTAKNLIRSIWAVFVRKCLERHPGLSNKQIVDAVMRSEKFSSGFRKRLYRLIRRIRKHA